MKQFLRKVSEKRVEEGGPQAAIDIDAFPVRKFKIISKKLTFFFMQVRVEVVPGQKLEAVIRKYAKGKQVDNSPFEKVSMLRLNNKALFYYYKAHQLRYMLQGLSMLRNKNFTQQMMKKVIDQIMGARGKGGVPMYTIQAASMSKREFDIIRHNKKVSITIYTQNQSKF